MRFFRREDRTPATSGGQEGNDPTGPSEASAPRPSKVPFAGLINAVRGRLRRDVKVLPEPGEPGPVTDDIGEKHVPPFERLMRKLRNLQEEVALLRRRRTLTLSVENRVIRGVVFQGREIVAWGIADPEDGDPFRGEPSGFRGDGDVSRMRMLLTELRARRARLVTDLPLYIPLIRHLDLRNIRQRFEDVVLSEVTAKIPFAQREVDIKWHLVEGKVPRQVMAIAVKKEMVDAHVQRLKEAGKGPVATYSQAAALGAAAGRRDAMLVHLTPDQEAVVLLRGGVPQAVYQVVMPEGGRSSKEQVEAVALAVEQMEGFNQTLGLGEGAQRLPIVLTGYVPSDGILQGELREMLQREVLLPSPPVVYPEGFPVAEYATNIGLALLAQAKPRGRRKGAERIAVSPNLLSERHIPVPVPFTAIGVFTVLALFAVTAFNLTPRVSEAVSDAAASARLLESKEDQSRGHRLKMIRATKLQEDARKFRSLTLELKSRIDALQRDMEALGPWFARVEAITESTKPPEVRVSGLTRKGSTYTLSGTAPQLKDVTQYAENLRRSGLFTDVIIRQVGAGVAKSPGDALSGEGLAFLAEGGGASAQPPAASEEEVSFTIEAAARHPTDEESNGPSQ